MIRESLRRLPEGILPEGTTAIGGYWTRTNDPEIDIVGADRAPIAHQITTVGSIKWHNSRPFDNHDLAQLMVHRSRPPGAGSNTPLIAVPEREQQHRTSPHSTRPDLIGAWKERPLDRR